MTAKIRFGFSVVLLTTFLGSSTISLASVLEEVIVTAQKREQNVQDIGIAITAMTGDQMEALGYNNAQHVTTMAPGCTPYNQTEKQIMLLRFVAPPSFHHQSGKSVAVYLDGVYVSQCLAQACSI